MCVCVCVHARVCVCVTYVCVDVSVNCKIYTCILSLQVSQIDHEMIQATALKMVFDILLLYGTKMFRSGGEDDEGDEEEDQERDDDEDMMADLSFSDEAVDKRQDGSEATHKLLKILIDFLDHEV